MAVIRYPGSKAKLAQAIRAKFPPEIWGELFSRNHRYCEPFFGAGAVGFEVLRCLHRDTTVTLNDKDPDMAALWRVVRESHLSLIQRVHEFVPTVDAFNSAKAMDGSPGRDIDRALRKLTLHRMSYSGLGFMSGGPLGGQDQGSNYKVDCRWNPTHICDSIQECHERLRRIRSLSILSCDFEEAMEEADEDTFVYLDPPYYEKGPILYKHSMVDDDHRRLAALLKTARYRWVLSYDEHPFIRALYEPWAKIEPITLTYTMARAKGDRPKNGEVLIMPR